VNSIDEDMDDDDLLELLSDDEDDIDDEAIEAIEDLSEMVNHISGRSINIADSQDDDKKNFQVQSHNTYAKLSQVHDSDFASDADEGNFFYDKIHQRDIHIDTDIDIDHEKGYDREVRAKINNVTVADKGIPNNRVLLAAPVDAGTVASQIEQGRDTTISYN
jgi:hypothetical protein